MKAMRNEDIGRTERASRRMRPQRYTKIEFPERRKKCVGFILLKTQQYPKMKMKLKINYIHYGFSKYLF